MRETAVDALDAVMLLFEVLLFRKAGHLLYQSCLVLTGDDLAEVWGKTLLKKMVQWPVYLLVFLKNSMKGRPAHGDGG